MKRIFIDPSYSAYENNKLFDGTDPVLNRDDTLAPYIKLKTDLLKKSVELLTYDLVKKFSPHEIVGDGYISFGNIRDLENIKKSGLRLLAFYLMEPPLVIEKNYKQLPYLSKYFEKIYTHNNNGDCFSLSGVDKSRLEKLYWPQPYGDVIEDCWNKKKRHQAIVIINGNHRPKNFPTKELYSQRIEWAVNLNKFMRVDLYGRGWNKLLSRSSWWPKFLLNYFKIQKFYLGPCGSKLEIMSQYDFALCFENLIMDGYITEKIFDCFYSGAIPIYRGGNDIALNIPKNCYIDIRDFKNAKELSSYLLNMTEDQKQIFRQAGRSFVQSPEGRKYFSIIDSFGWFL